jgi:uncharacterized membrane protein
MVWTISIPIPSSNSDDSKTFILKPQNEEAGGKRVDLNTSKYLGGIGALLLFITILPYVSTVNFFGLISLIGVIMLLVAAKGLADFYREGGIFNNALYGTILSIVGVVAFVGVLFYSLFSLFSGWGWTMGTGDLTAFASSLTDLTGFASLAFGDIMGFLSGIIIALIYSSSLSLQQSSSGNRCCSQLDVQA